MSTKNDNDYLWLLPIGVIVESIRWRSFLKNHPQYDSLLDYIKSMDWYGPTFKWALIIIAAIIIFIVLAMYFSKDDKNTIDSNDATTNRNN